MAVAIRLKRTGKHKQPFYRVVAIDGRESAQGKPLEVLGSYDPRAAKIKDKITLDQERYDYWIKVGAKPSETVASLMKIAASGKERPKMAKKSRKQITKDKAAKASDRGLPQGSAASKSVGAADGKTVEKKEEQADGEKG